MPRIREKVGEFMDAIRAEGLSKSYDGKQMALDSLSLTVPQGGVCGFLGPNGAGKTTAVKLMTGLLKPTKGGCEVMGVSPAEHPEEVHAVCGVMTETAKMYRQMTGLQNLMFFGQVSGQEPEESRQRASELLKELDIWDARDKRLDQYSTGMAQRLSLARALMHRPQVLFLDEPTSGLDPESAQAVNELIAKLAKKDGATVFLCTHQLRYAQDICDSYGIIQKGRLLLSGDFDTLAREMDCRMKADIRLGGESRPEGFEEHEGWWRTDVLSENEMPKLIRQLVDAGEEIYEAKLTRPTLEEIYFKCLENGKREVRQ